MTVVRVGATKQYSDNWDSIFGRSGKKKMTKPAPASAKAKPKGKKKAAKKR
jgi:hypothetical protein